MEGGVGFRWSLDILHLGKVKEPYMNEVSNKNVT